MIPRARKFQLNAYNQFDHFLLSVESIASWWCGIGRDDDKMDLGDISELLGVRGKGDDCISFKIRKTTDKQLQLSPERHGDTLPFAVGRAALGCHRAAGLLRVYRESMAGNLDAWSDLEELFVIRDSNGPSSQAPSR